MAWPPTLQDINTIEDMRSNFKRDVNEYGKQYPKKRSQGSDRKKKTALSNG